jgi:diguanylate cyclase (GGDEF)-like protein
MATEETERLAALRAHEVLDTAPEPEFDALARLAAQACGTPLAWVAFVDADRLWCKASIGLEDREWPRDLDLCASEPGLRVHASAPIVDAQSHVLGVVAVGDTAHRELTEAQQASLRDLASLALALLESRQRARQLSHLAKTDHLTGIANRAQYDLALDVEMRHSMRTGEAFTVLCMDLDGFQEIVQGFGHGAGDEVLCEVTRRLNQQVRLGDVLARLGTDEFGVVMRHGAKDSAEVLAKRMVQAVRQPIELSSGDTVGVGISVGIAAYDDSVESVPSLLAQADQALYEAKKQNERRWKMFVGGR